MRRKWLLFLYSTPNIVGCTLGLLALLALFAGLIKSFWPVIVAGLYAIGYVATPRASVESLSGAAVVSAPDIKRQLADLLAKIRKKVSSPVYDKVKSINDSIVALLPHLSKMDRTDNSLHVVRQTATDYLPHMLENYLSLPPAFARFHPVRGDRTAREYLLEQLDILDAEMREILNKVLTDDTEALIAHGRFLKDKFAKSDDWLN